MRKIILLLIIFLLNSPALAVDDGSDTFYIEQNLGIKKRSPSDALHVNGSSLFESGTVVFGPAAPVSFQDSVLINNTLRIPTGAGAGFVLNSDATGNASWISAASLSVNGDNLGNHTATTNLNLANNNIDNVLQIQANVFNGGIFLGDGSGLTGVSGSDDLGNHTATTNLNMAGSDINGASQVEASVFNGGIFIGDGSRLTGVSGSDDLGNHTATTNLNMAASDINGASQIEANVFNGGIFIGDGSRLTGVPGTDDLGNHTATTNLDLNNNNIVNVNTLSTAGLNTNTLTVNTLTTNTQAIFSSGVRISSSPALGHVLTSDALGNATWVDPGTVVTSGDNLGNHTATTNLDMDYNEIKKVQRIAIGTNFTDGSDLYIRSSTGNGTRIFNEIIDPSGFADIVTVAIDSGDNVVKKWATGSTGDSRPDADGGQNTFYIFQQTDKNNVDVKEYRLAITDAGELGIGLHNPTAKLDVGGGSKDFIDGVDDLLVKDDAEIDGDLYANRLFGDGSGLTGVGSNTTILNTTIENGTINNSEIDNSKIKNSTIYKSRIKNSTFANGDILHSYSYNGYLQDPTINGLATFTENSIALLQGQIQIPENAGAGRVLTSNKNGDATWQAPFTPPVQSQDNLGNHEAEKDLQMGGFDIEDAGSITAGDFYGGTFNGSFVGDGSKLTGLDNAIFKLEDEIISNSGSKANIASNDFIVGSETISHTGSAAATTKLAFDKSKGALRVGSISSTQWDDANIGETSAAFGRNNIASGVDSFAIGEDNEASGLRSFAGGVGSKSTAENSFSFGRLNQATGEGSFAIGEDNLSSAENAIAIGSFAQSTKEKSITIGDWVKSSGENSITIGKGYANNTFIENNIDNSLAIGFNTTAPTLFVGPADSSLPASPIKDGKVGIGTNAPQDLLDVDGTLRTKEFRMIPGAGADKVLTSDGIGNGTWRSLGDIDGTGDNLGNHTAQQELDMSNQNITNAQNININNRVGINKPSPVVSLDTAGNIKVGFENTPCNTTYQGSMRYNAPIRKLQLCDGLKWMNVVVEDPDGPTDPDFEAGTGWFEAIQAPCNDTPGNICAATTCETTCRANNRVFSTQNPSVHNNGGACSKITRLLTADNATCNTSSSTLAEGDLSFSSDTDEQRFCFCATDTNAIACTTTTPRDNASGVAIDADLILTCNQPIAAGSGNIILRNTTGSGFIFIDVNSSNITFSGNTVRINPTDDLLANTNYYVNIQPRAIQNPSLTKAFAGNSDQTTWNFRTAGPVIPVTSVICTPSLPTFDARNVNTNTNLELTCDRPVAKGTGGTLSITNAPSTNSQSLNATSNRITVAGNKVTVDLENNLRENTDYYGSVQSGVIKDAASSGIFESANTQVWRFTTRGTLTCSPFPADNSTNVELDSDLRLTCNRAPTAGTGLIKIGRNTPSGSIEYVESIDVTNSSKVSFSGNNITIHTANDFAADTNHFITFPANTIQDANNPLSNFVGFGSSSGWNFRTKAAGQTFSGHYVERGWGDRISCHNLCNQGGGRGQVTIPASELCLIKQEYIHKNANWGTRSTHFLERYTPLNGFDISTCFPFYNCQGAHFGDTGSSCYRQVFSGNAGKSEPTFRDYNFTVLDREAMQPISMRCGNIVALTNNIVQESCILPYRANSLPYETYSPTVYSKYEDGYQAGIDRAVDKKEWNQSCFCGTAD